KHLRRETKDFVPQIHAATLIGQDPERYGFEFTVPEPLAVETFTVPPSTDLRRLAARSGVSLETLRALNPVLVRPVTPPGAPWTLVIPVGSLASMQAALAPPPAPARRTAVAQGPARAAAERPAHVAAGHADSVHVVRPRDTVSSIARKYGVTVAEVLRWNRLEEQT